MATTKDVNGLPEITGFLKKTSFRGQTIAAAVVKHLVDQGASFYLEIEKGADYAVYVKQGYLNGVEAVIFDIERKTPGYNK
jgi:hypothetical protein